MDYSKLTLGEMLSSPNEIIQRNATSILKTMQRCEHKKQNESGGMVRCLDCGAGEETKREVHNA